MDTFPVSLKLPTDVSEETMEGSEISCHTPANPPGKVLRKPPEGFQPPPAPLHSNATPTKKIEMKKKPASMVEEKTPEKFTASQVVPAQQPETEEDVWSSASMLESTEDSTSVAFSTSLDVGMEDFNSSYLLSGQQEIMAQDFGFQIPAPMAVTASFMETLGGSPATQTGATANEMVAGMSAEEMNAYILQSVSDEPHASGNNVVDQDETPAQLAAPHVTLANQSAPSFLESGLLTTEPLAPEAASPDVPTLHLDEESVWALNPEETELLYELEVVEVEDFNMQRILHPDTQMEEPSIVMMLNPQNPPTVSARVNFTVVVPDMYLTTQSTSTQQPASMMNVEEVQEVQEFNTQRIIQRVERSTKSESQSLATIPATVNFTYEVAAMDPTTRSTQATAHQQNSAVLTEAPLPSNSGAPGVLPPGPEDARSRSRGRPARREPYRIPEVPADTSALTPGQVQAIKMRRATEQNKAASKKARAKKKQAKMKEELELEFEEQKNKKLKEKFMKMKQAVEVKRRQLGLPVKETM